MEAKEYKVLYNILTHHSYPEGITKNKKDAFRNKERNVTDEEI